MPSKDRRCSQSEDSEERSDDELENETSAWDTDGSGNAGAHICHTTRRNPSRSTIGWIPDDRWGLGDLRSAFREAQIERLSPPLRMPSSDDPAPVESTPLKTVIPSRPDL